MQDRYDIVSRVAYYIGVDKRYFKDEADSLKLSTYNELDKKDENRLIRCICRCRDQIVHNFKKITTAWAMGEVRSLLTMSEYMPSEVANTLYSAKIDISGRDHIATIQVSKKMNLNDIPFA